MKNRGNKRTPATTLYTPPQSRRGIHSTHVCHEHLARTADTKSLWTDKTDDCFFNAQSTAKIISGRHFGQEPRNPLATLYIVTTKQTISIYTGVSQHFEQGQKKATPRQYCMCRDVVRVVVVVASGAGQD